MAVSVRYDGFEELRRFLEELPETAKDTIGGIVRRTVDAVEADLVAVYPPGEMRAAVRSYFVPTGGAIGWQGVVLSPTPQAHWWEYGTVVRATQQGWNRGSEPAHPDQGLVSIAIRHRAEMYTDLFAYLEALGFTVTGTP